MQSRGLELEGEETGWRFGEGCQAMFRQRGWSGQGESSDVWFSHRSPCLLAGLLSLSISLSLTGPWEEPILCVELLLLSVPPVSWLPPWQNTGDSAGT